MRPSSYLNVQAHVLDLEGGLLADIDAHELGRVLVKDVDVAQTEQQQLLPDGGGKTREHESHGCGGVPGRVGC